MRVSTYTPALPVSADILGSTIASCDAEPQDALEMPPTTHEFSPRAQTLDPSLFDGKDAVVVFDKTSGRARRITGRLQLSPDGAKLTVHRPDGSGFRTIPVPYVVRVVVLDYKPPAY